MAKNDAPVTAAEAQARRNAEQEEVRQGFLKDEAKDHNLSDNPVPVGGAPDPAPPAEADRPKDMHNSPAYPDSRRPGIGKIRPNADEWKPIESDPEALRKLQDPLGVLDRDKPENTQWVDGTDAYGNPVRIPV